MRRYDRQGHQQNDDERVGEHPNHSLDRGANFSNICRHKHVTRTMLRLRGATYRLRSKMRTGFLGSQARVCRRPGIVSADPTSSLRGIAGPLHVSVLAVRGRDRRRRLQNPVSVRLFYRRPAPYFTGTPDEQRGPRPVLAGLIAAHSIGRCRGAGPTGNALSIRANSGSVRCRSPAPLFSAACSGFDAFGIVYTVGHRAKKRSAT